MIAESSLLTGSVDPFAIGPVGMDATTRVAPDVVLVKIIPLGTTAGTYTIIDGQGNTVGPFPAGLPAEGRDSVLVLWFRP
jgi:hypothetical protein